jgi:hypothetical protein
MPSRSRERAPLREMGTGRGTGTGRTPELAFRKEHAAGASHPHFKVWIQKPAGSQRMEAQIQRRSVPVQPPALQRVLREAHLVTPSESHPAGHDLPSESPLQRPFSCCECRHDLLGRGPREKVSGEVRRQMHGAREPVHGQGHQPECEDESLQLHRISSFVSICGYGTPPANRGVTAPGGCHPGAGHVL